ncbi:HAMP domain-containing sensor histidine kinase [Paenibacillus terrigena]|uniref:HAMP domain-containing sensor histidine kinase n=1 Tax=Paenibacillus terrigena TaxID=369333 RepID=UPI0028D0B1C9|nr:HAMP domain-containing sensor histidine kinase [Paenibacillus terrigena]
MRTIRGRIFIALIIVMIFSVFTSVYMVDRLVDGMLMDQARNQLHIQMEKGIQIIEGGDPEDLSSDDLELRFRDRMYYADFFILNKEDKIIAAGDDEMIGRTAHISMGRQDHFFELNQEKMMYTHQNLKNGLRIIVYTPMDILNQVSDRILHISIRSVIISFVVIFIVGLWLVWNTTRPLMKLKEAVSRFEPSYRGARMPKGDDTEIGQLMNTFHTMSERIRLHHQQQTEFLQNISHELRTPLMSIQGYAEAIKDQVVSVEKGVEVVSTESKRLIQLVDKLLQLTRLETLDEVWKMTHVDLKELIEQAVQLLGPAASERQVKIEMHAAAMELAIPAEQIFQLTINFLQNAVRYAATEVVVTMEQTPSGFCIIVDDDGPGVPIAERQSVFERNYIGEAGVTGIGLAICKHIADKLQTKVECLESPNGGARFTFEYNIK